MNKNKIYSLKESASTYILTLIAVVGGSIFMLNMVSVVASLQNADVNEVFASQWVSYVNMFISAILFLLVYIGVNLFKKKDFKVAENIYHRACEFFIQPFDADVDLRAVY